MYVYMYAKPVETKGQNLIEIDAGMCQTASDSFELSIHIFGCIYSNM